MSFNSTIKINGRFQYSLGIKSVDDKFSQAAIKESKEGFDRKIEMERAIKEARAKRPVVHSSRKVGRNELCPCGSSKKFKKCCINK